jgi:hypothetical protein
MANPDPILNTRIPIANKRLDEGFACDAASGPLPDHLARLSTDGEWAVWRCCCLRGAGFPASEVLKLSSPELGISVDQLIEAEERQSRVLRDLTDRILREADEAAMSGHEALRRHLRKRLKSLNQGRAPEPLAIDCKSNDSINAALKSQRELEELREAFANEYSLACRAASRALCDTALDDRFREAVLWQSRTAFHTGVKALLAETSNGSERRNTHQRQHESLIASYLQRYCVKNDSVGFFGPVGWARLVDSGEVITARPGADLLAKRSVYFESWAIDALAEALIKSDRSLLRWAAPRLAPVYFCSGGILRFPLEKPASLSPAQAALIEQCDGERPAHEIARDIVSRFADEMRSEADVYRVLEYLRKTGVIYWDLEPPLTPKPEAHLGGLIERIGDAKLRAGSSSKLESLERARAAVAAVAGDPQQLDAAMGDLDNAFTRVTGSEPNRAPGKMYAGRGLLYEDCRRDIEVDLGPEAIRALGSPLSLLLSGARWLTSRAAAECGAGCVEIYDELARSRSEPFVEAVDFWLRAQRDLLGATSKQIALLKRDFQDRWADILDIAPEARRVRRSSEALRERVSELFNAPKPGWNAACYHSPDVMISAPSVDALRRGEYEFVLGELHVGVNTVGLSLFLEQHPNREELLRASELDVPEPRILIAPPKFGTSLSGRNHMALISPKDFRLEFSVHSRRTEQGRALPLGSLIVAKERGNLVVQSRDGRQRFDMIEVLADPLTNQVLNNFKLLRPAEHLPRITIDRLVVSREQWNLHPSELSFAYEKSGEARFLKARQWARDCGAPRFVFVKSPVEVKPVYVDMDSPIYVEQFAKLIRRTGNQEVGAEAITVSEMSPTPDQTWLPDSEGRKYTSELRMVTVDLRGRRFTLSGKGQDQTLNG